MKTTVDNLKQIKENTNTNKYVVDSLFQQSRPDLFFRAGRQDPDDRFLDLGGLASV